MKSEPKTAKPEEKSPMDSLLSTATATATTPEPAPPTFDVQPAAPAAPEPPAMKSTPAGSMAAMDMVRATVVAQAELKAEEAAAQLAGTVYFMTCPRRPKKHKHPHIGIFFTVNPFTVEVFDSFSWFTAYHGKKEGHKDIFWGDIPADIYCQQCYVETGEVVQLRVADLGMQKGLGRCFRVLERHKQEYISSVPRERIVALIAEGRG